MFKRFQYFKFVRALLIHLPGVKFCKLASPSLLLHQLPFQQFKFAVSQKTIFREPPLEPLLLTVPSSEPPCCASQKYARVECGNHPTKWLSLATKIKCSCTYCRYGFIVIDHLIFKITFFSESYCL
jgi:hypothetical protein